MVLTNKTGDVKIDLKR